jgi:hypothetical protein
MFIVNAKNVVDDFSASCSLLIPRNILIISRFHTVTLYSTFIYVREHIRCLISIRIFKLRVGHRLNTRGISTNTRHRVNNSNTRRLRCKLKTNRVRAVIMAVVLRYGKSETSTSFFLPCRTRGD